MTDMQCKETGFGADNNEKEVVFTYLEPVEALHVCFIPGLHCLFNEGICIVLQKNNIYHDLKRVLYLG